MFILYWLFSLSSQNTTDVAIDTSPFTSAFQFDTLPDDSPSDSGPSWTEWIISQINAIEQQMKFLRTLFKIYFVNVVYDIDPVLELTVISWIIFMALIVGLVLPFFFLLSFHFLYSFLCQSLKFPNFRFPVLFHDNDDDEYYRYLHYY